MKDKERILMVIITRIIPPLVYLCHDYKDKEEYVKSDMLNVVKLEKGDLNLDDSMAKFEEGMKLSKECSKILEDAEKKITILLEQDGKMEEEDFEY